MSEINPEAALSRVSTALGIAGLLAGFVVALSFLSGDAQGRVNLLYLLLLFVALPLVGLALSLLFLLRKSGRGLAGWLLELPVWPATLRNRVLHLAPGRQRKYWLFYQSQLFALGFGAGGLLALLLLLLVSDVSFVWRSTLLDASSLYPVLSALALPWYFWTGAQPSLELLQLSQEYRLGTQDYTAVELGQWWQFAVAAQVTYTLLPRALMALLARIAFGGNPKSHVAGTERKVLHVNPLNVVPMQGPLAPLADRLPDEYVLLDWAGVPSAVLEDLKQSKTEPLAVLRADPVAEPEPELLRQISHGHPVVIVKAWEPPMGELHDYLTVLEEKLAGPGLILPLDWNDTGRRPVRDEHLQEWRRFGGTLAGWTVLNYPFPGAPQS